MLTDYHIHTQHSGDIPAGEGASVAELCEKALSEGFESIAITDHFDVDGLYLGYFPWIDYGAVMREVFEAKERYEGKLELLFGVEFAQGAHMKDKADELLSTYPFEFILGSVHAVRGIIDFFNVDYPNTSDGELIRLFDLYLEEMNEMLDLFEISSLAHINYPYRYYKRANKDGLLNFESREVEYFEPILKRIIEKGIALEVNTSGLRQGLGATMPDDKVIKRYRELGGELLTVGSDAHRLRDVGKDVAATYEKLKSLGFRYITAFKDKKPRQIKLV